MLPFIDLKPLAEFVDRTGKVRAIAGCSVVGYFEFWERIEQLHHILKQPTCDAADSWHTLYRSSPQFRHLITRCLELNGIDPEWVSLDQTEQFLFHRWDEEREEYAPGWLVELNNQSDKPKAERTEDPLSVEELLAAMSTTVGNLKEAMELAQSVRPAQSLFKAVDAEAQIKAGSHTKSKRRKSLEKLRRSLTPEQRQRLFEKPVEPEKEISFEDVQRLLGRGAE